MVGRMAVTLAATALIAALAGTVHAESIAVFGTGVDDNGVTVVYGSQDPHYQFIEIPAGQGAVPRPAIVAAPHPNYLVGDALGTVGTRWVATSAAASASVPGGRFVYRTTFDLTGLDPSTALILGSVAVDDTMIDVLINGVSTGVTASGFRQLSGVFTIGTGFVDGVNTLDFVVLNSGFNPSGFRAALMGEADPVVEEAPAATVIEATLDIKPGGDSDKIKLGCKGKLPVAVLGTAEFDPSTIDLASIRLGAAAVVMKKHDRYQASMEDTDGDGLDDLVLHFEIRDLGIDETSTELAFSALTTDGIEVTAVADITVKAKKSKSDKSGKGKKDKSAHGDDDEEDDDDGDDDRDGHGHDGKDHGKGYDKGHGKGHGKGHP